MHGHPTVVVQLFRCVVVGHLSCETGGRRLCYSGGLPTKRLLHPATSPCTDATDNHLTNYMSTNYTIYAALCKRNHGVLVAHMVLSSRAVWFLSQASNNTNQEAMEGYLVPLQLLRLQNSQRTTVHMGSTPARSRYLPCNTRTVKQTRLCCVDGAHIPLCISTC